MLESLFSHNSPPSTDGPRLRRIEAKLDLILNHFGLTYRDDSGLGSESRGLADSGRKIEAIKAYREQTGAGLAEAKRAVEAYLLGKG